MSETDRPEGPHGSPARRRTRAPSTGETVLPPSLERFQFNWDTMHTIVSGRSAIDAMRLRLSGPGAAERFLRSYGYDLGRPEHRDEFEDIRTQALHFIREVLLRDRPGVVVPAELTAAPVLDLLAMAATTSSGERLRQAWACALLRVMHTFAHAGNYFQEHYYSEIREQVLQRFVDQVQVDGGGAQVLRGSIFDVPIVRLEVKEAKPRRSVVLKLLHKQENVAYDLFDHIGVRIIVPRPVDALFAVRALRERHTIVYPNIKPTRSHNTLLDLDAFDAIVRETLEAFHEGRITEEEAVTRLAEFTARPPDASVDPGVWNQFTSPKYRSIQFTCRQMIRLPDPIFDRVMAARRRACDVLDGQALDAILDALPIEGLDREIRFFFPYEVQVMDIGSYEEAIRGRASYDEYKRRQIEAARDRVLGPVLRAMSEHEATRPR